METYETRGKSNCPTDGSTDAELIADGGRSRCSECGAILPEEIEPGTGVYCTQCGTGQLVTDGGEEHVPVLLVAYEDDADLEVNQHGEIENHDELVEAGQTYDEIRMLSRSSIEETPLEVDIVEPGDSLYYDAVADLEPGEAIRVDDMLSDEDGDDDA